MDKGRKLMPAEMRKKMAGKTRKKYFMKKRVSCVLAAALLVGMMYPGVQPFAASGEFVSGGAEAVGSVPESSAGGEFVSGGAEAAGPVSESSAGGEFVSGGAEAAGSLPESGAAAEHAPLWNSKSPAATGSDARPAVVRAVMRENFWDGWNGDADFEGDGTEETPYRIRSLSELMGLSQAVSEGESFEGQYFILTCDIDLADLDVGNGSWNPIGWYQNADGMERDQIHPFSGHFDGKGHTVSNLDIIQSDVPLKNVGLFGVIDGGTVCNLTVRAGNVCGADNAAVLAGMIRGDSVIYEVKVSGYVSASGGQSGNAGGIAASVFGDGGRVTIENCTADNIEATSDQAESCVGGIAGEVKEADLADNIVQTGRSNSNHIQGSGYVGGIAGRMEEAGIYNSYVNGMIGGSGSRAVGGIVGEYVSGNLVLARFGGEIGPTRMGAARHEGTFVGTRSGSHPFRYGTEPDDNLSYLFASSIAKARQAVGSGIADDNTIPASAHVGYWIDDQRNYYLLSGNSEVGNTGMYFYQELEEGVRYIITEKLRETYAARDMEDGVSFRPDHFAPGAQGQPVRGYLLSVPRIDTRNSNGTYDRDVAVLTAMPEGNLSYYRVIDKNHAAAVEAGVTVTVATSPRNSDGNRYQMAADPSEPEGVKAPVYINEWGRPVPMNYVSGGTYTFTMPKRDTQINAEYVKVTTELTMTPAETELTVIQTRTGDRKKPQLVTEVHAAGGVLIARYIEGASDHSVLIQPVRIHCEHNADGGVADQTVRWSVDDSSLIELDSPDGYTGQDALIMPNLNSPFIQETLAAQVKAQADGGYLEAIQPTVYERHAVVSAASNPKTSADGVSVYGNCKVTVKFQILDYTTRRVEGLNLNRSDIVMTVTRKLTGNRMNPTETITCSAPIVLSAGLYPEQPFYKNVSWSDRESGASIFLTPGGENASQCEVAVRFDPDGQANPAWIQNVINEDNQKKKENPYEKVSGFAEHTEIVTATSEDQTHGIISAECRVTIRFETVDQTGSRSFGGSSGSSSGSGSSGGSSGSGSSGGGSGSGSGGNGFGGASGGMYGPGSAAGPGAQIRGSGAGGAIMGPGAVNGAQTVSGIWTQTADGRWMFAAGEKIYRGQWAYISNPYADAAKAQPPSGWFCFDENGYMMTGWHWIAGADGRMRCYYFHEVPDGAQGMMYADTVTPDGYQVDGSGAWTAAGVVQLKP